MHYRTASVLPVLCVLAVGGLRMAPAEAQMDNKGKPPMYTYVSNWAMPRAKWGDMEKQEAADMKVFEKALAGGEVVAYGADRTMVHDADGYTHDSFWSAMSVAGVLGVLDELYKGGAATAPVLSSVTKHSDNLFVSRFYNWKPGAVKDGYIHGASYKLKADAPDDAVETISAGFVVPLMEKLMADGTVLEYEVDTEWIHTQAPGTFWIFYITPTAAGLDKAYAALGQALQANGLVGPALGSMVDFPAHRDFIGRTNSTYK